MKLFIPKVFQYYPLVKVGFGRGGFLHYFFPFQDLDDSKRHLDDDGGGEGGRRIPSVLPGPFGGPDGFQWVEPT
ncbi:hypothetical protein PV325_000403 [Microctonus aethiopoides]|nr:hypothetical protein PV325_000403 [Microctonus aethiopoides]